MKSLDLTTSPIDAAIRSRPAAPPVIVWVHRPERNAWCILRRATGGRTIFLCLDWIGGNEPVNVLTSGDRHPHNACPACETELAAGTPGAAVAVEPEPFERPDVQTAVSRTLTPCERPRTVRFDTDGAIEWEKS